MNKQLTLIPYRKDWYITSTQKAIGLNGIRKARRVLAAHKPKEGKMELEMRFPIDHQSLDLPRIAVHDGDGLLMRDLFIGGRMVGTLFCANPADPTRDVQSAPDAHDSFRSNRQDVGFAACFMS